MADFLADCGRRRTALYYKYRLGRFDNFLKTEYDLDADNVPMAIKNGSIQDVYELLNKFKNYLKNHGKTSNNMKHHLSTITNYLRYSDIDVDRDKLKYRVKLPRSDNNNVLKDEEAFDKDDIIKILNACRQPRLRTYVGILASTGMRAREAHSRTSFMKYAL